MDTIFREIVNFIRKVFNTEDYIPLHEPRFWGNEKKYLNDCIDSTFVSSVGQYVDRFENEVAKFTGSKYAVAVVNGTQALYVGLNLVGAKAETEVITQALTFIATANAIQYTGAEPIFLDVDKDTLGLSPASLQGFLRENTEQRGRKCWNKQSGKQIVACVPMHTFGHACKIREIKEICDRYQLALVEDAAESLGSHYKSIHTGRFGKLGILSFNGNKIITTGGGGMIITDDDQLAQKAKHLTTTAKVPHVWEFNHDEIGFNYRLPNLNAALGVAQLEQLPEYIEKKRYLAGSYKEFFDKKGVSFVTEPKAAKSNYWLNSVILDDLQQRDDFLEYSNKKGIMTRCLWTPMHLLPMYRHCQKDKLKNTNYFFNRIVNIPSSVV